MSEPAEARRWRGRTPSNTRNNGCFACGPINARGLHLDVKHEGGLTYVDFTPDEHWQGVDGVVHGGLIATVLDEVMAWELYGYDILAVTAKLEVTYRQPVPTGRPLRATAQLIEDRGRAKRLKAEIQDESGTVLAAAESLFVSVPKAREAELRARYPED